MKIIDERTGDRQFAKRGAERGGADWYAVATAYFTQHPNTSAAPAWAKAELGDIWLLDVGGDCDLYLLTAIRGVRLYVSGTRKINPRDSRIARGVRKHPNAAYCGDDHPDS